MTLQSWRMHSAWKDQVFVASSRGLYQGPYGPFFHSRGGFTGMVDFCWGNQFNFRKGCLAMY